MRRGGNRHGPVTAVDEQVQQVSAAASAAGWLCCAVGLLLGPAFFAQDYAWRSA